MRFLADPGAQPAGQNDGFHAVPSGEFRVGRCGVVVIMTEALWAALGIMRAGKQ
jgi:hypothetical protein